MRFPLRSYLITGISVGVLASCQNPEKAAVSPSQKETSDSLQSQTDSPADQINRQIIQDPDNPKLYVKRAKIFLQQNLLSEAYKDVLKALEIDSSYSDAYELLADIAIIQKRGKEVKKYLDKAIEKNPKNVSAYLKLAQLYLVFENFEDALKAVNNALKSDMYNADAYYLKSSIFLFAGDTNKAISNLQTAIEQNPEFYKAYVDLGYIYAKKGNPIALEYYNNAIQINPTNPVAIYNKSIFLQEKGFLDKAMEGYDLLLKINPNDVRAHYNKGYIYLTQWKDYPKAISSFKNVIKINASYPDALYNLGLAYELSGNKDSALFYFQKTLNIQPQHVLAATGLSRLKNR